MTHAVQSLHRSLRKKHKHWARFLHARFYNNGVSFNYYKSSAVWCGIQQALQSLKPDLTWCIGYNSDCRLWDDDWSFNGALVDLIEIPEDLLYTRNM